MITISYRLRKKTFLLVSLLIVLISANMLFSQSTDSKIENQVKAPPNSTGNNAIPYGPEIDVKYRSTSIPNSTGFVNFGSVYVGSDTTLTFKIYNTASPYGALLYEWILHLGTVTISGENAADFIVTSQPDSTVMYEGGSTSFKIKFAPVGGGEREATITIPNDDGNESPYTFTIRGTSILYYVDSSRPDDTGDGKTWATAKKYLQSGIALTSPGNHIWVAAGTYYPDEGDGQTNNSVYSTFSIPDSVHVYGGFAGTETELSQRDLSANETILSGDIDKDEDITYDDDNAYHTVYFYQVSEATLLDGFTITGGYANGSSGFENYGGGIFNDGHGSGVRSNPQIKNCIIRCNQAGAGGGIYNLGNGGGETNPTITNCVISGNRASMCGGIYNAGYYSDSDASPVLTNCTITGNHGGSKGGGMYNDAQNSGNSQPELINCILWNNHASESPYVYNNSALPSFSYSNVQGSGGSSSWSTPLGTDGGNNIDSNPLFVFSINGAYAPSPDGNFHLYDGSPSLNSGINSANSETFDVEGDTRVQNEIIDMGAYEGGVPTPEIIVVGNLLEIADGDTTPSSEDDTDFDSTNIAEGNVDRTFFIHNTGTATLYLGEPAATQSTIQLAAHSISGAVSLSGTHASDFCVTEQPADSVVIGDSTSFTIRFDPSAKGLRTATVSIYNSDITENPYNFSIQGTGLTTPTVTTTPAYSVTTTTASSGGNVTDDGGATVTARGTCWGSAENPTTDSSHTADGTGTGEFTSSLTDLTPNTWHHVRAYAENSAGTGYSADTSFCTKSVPPSTETVTCDTNGTTTLTLSAVGGFGPGTVEYYECELVNFDSLDVTQCSSTTSKLASRSCGGCHMSPFIWNSGDLTIGLPTANTNYMLVLADFNAANEEHGILFLGPFQWDGTPISPVTSLDANASGNSLALNWTNPQYDAHEIEVWVKGFGGYPQYTGSAPTFPATPTEAAENGWVKVSDSLLTSLTYAPASRDFYYTAVFVEDFAEHYSAAVIDSSLSYWLGDVNATPDGQVNAADIAILASAYRTSLGDDFYAAVCDVGPTLTRRRTGRPTPDGEVGFEDLMIFAMNYENTGEEDQKESAIAKTTGPVTLNLSILKGPINMHVKVELENNEGSVKGLNIPLLFGEGLSLYETKKGELWDEEDFFTTLSASNTIEISGATLKNNVIAGNGTLARLSFAVCGENTDLQIANAIARHADNTDIEINYAYTEVTEDESIDIPTEYKLHQNFPNPFNPSTTIMYDLKESGRVKITLFNINGQRITTVLDQVKNAGYHSFVYKAGNLPSGVYIYQIEVNDFRDVRKLVLMK